MSIFRFGITPSSIALEKKMSNEPVEDLANAMELPHLQRYFGGTRQFRVELARELLLGAVAAKIKREMFDAPPATPRPRSSRARR
jgi:hypothetical protein